MSEPLINELLKYITTKLDDVDINSKKIDINPKDFSGNTALHLAVRDGKSFMVKAFVGHGANVHIKNLMGNKPIDLLSNHKKETNTEIHSILKKEMEKTAEPSYIYLYVTRFFNQCNQQ